MTKASAGSKQGKQVRLQRYIAQSGLAARRKAEEMILAGRVVVDGKVVRTLGTKVDPTSANVQVDGEPVAPQDHFYILFNKPKGCITAVTDDRGRLTVMDYLPNLPVNVAPVGRLDYYSEGVLLLTNDGELAAKLLGPRSHVAKTYHVKIRGQLTREDLERMRTGVTLDDGTVTLPAEVDVLQGGQSKHDWLVITLHEGKSRQIHRMVEALGHQVTKLQRVSFAGLTFHGLRIGDARELTQQELNDLRELVGLDRSAVARGRWNARREDTDRTRREHAERLAAAPQPSLPGFGAEPPPPSSEPDDEDETAFERQLEAARHRGRGARPSRDAAPMDRDSRGSRADRPDDRGARAERGPRTGRPSRGDGPRADRGPRTGGRPSRGDGPRADRGPRAGGRPSRGDGPRADRGERPTRSDGPRTDRGGRPDGARPRPGAPARGSKPGGRPSAGRPTTGGRPKPGGGAKRGAGANRGGRSSGGRPSGGKRR